MESTFKTFHVLRDIRITLSDGKSHVLKNNSTVEFDGGQIKIGGSIHSNPSFAGAINLGWVVPEGSNITHHSAQPANLTMRQAAPRGPERAVVNNNHHVVTEEDRNVGNIGQIRSAAKVGRKTFNPTSIVSDNEDAIVVGKMKNPTHHSTEVSAENVMRVAQYTRTLDGTQYTAPVVEPVRRDNHLPPTGVVPFNTPHDFNLHVGGGPRPAPAPAPVPTPAPAPAPAPEYQDPRVQELLAAIAREKQEEQLKKEEEELLRAMQQDSGAAPEEEEEDLPLDLAQRVQMIRAVIPNFEWDMTRPWKTRVADAVKQYGSKKVYLQAILSVETDAVKNHIQRALKESKSA